MPNLYLINDDFEQTGETVRQFDRAGQWVYEAIELMRIAGQEEQANMIHEVWLRAFRHEPCILERDDINKLLGLLDGFEAKLVGSVVDEKWMVDEEQLPELRARTSFELEESRGPAALHAVGEAMSRVSALRVILEDARAENLRIFVD